MAGPIRQPIDIASLEQYLSRYVPEIKLPIVIKQFGFGQSNPTYQINARDGNKYVLRKKPPGKLVHKTAHQVEREYHIIRALEMTDVPVPKTYCLCEDNGIIGTPFYIMEFLDGRIIEDPTIPDVIPAHRREMWHDAVRTLAKLHRINAAQVGLVGYGKSSGFYDRQIKTFGAIEHAQAQVKDVETKELVGSIPHVDEILAYFKDRRYQPKDRNSPIHGDYKIDNLVFHQTEPRVIGILDWEMSTIGHPLADLINLTTPYFLVNQDILKHSPSFKDGVTVGLPTLPELVNLYVEIAGWDPSPDLSWGIAFGFFRMTCIYQGIAARYAVRQASSAQAKHNAQTRHPAGRLAWDQVQRNQGDPKRKPKL